MYVMVGGGATANHEGSGNANGVYGGFHSGRASGTGTTSINFLVGDVVNATLNNPNATVQKYHGINNQLLFSAGTVTEEAAVALLDIDSNAAAIINGDFSYLYIKQNSVYPTISGDARSIYSNSILPSTFPGSDWCSSPQYSSPAVGVSPQLFPITTEWDFNGDLKYVQKYENPLVTPGVEITDFKTVNSTAYVEVPFNPLQFLFDRGNPETPFTSFPVSIDPDLSTRCMIRTGADASNQWNTNTPWDQTASESRKAYFKFAIGIPNPTWTNTNKQTPYIMGDLSDAVTFQYQESGSNISFNNDNTFRVLQNGSTKLILNSAGNVGIGTTIPAYKLDVTGSARIDGVLRVGTTAQNGEIKIIDSNGKTFSLNSDNVGNNKFAIEESGTNVRYLVIDGTTSNVGIGVTAPSQKLEVDGQVLSDGYRLAAMQTAPATRNSTGTLGEIVIDGNHIYVCYATDSWSRVALDTSW